jgi:GNAT superfamily N-acetyltransferase
MLILLATALLGLLALLLLALALSILLFPAPTVAPPAWTRDTTPIARFKTGSDGRILVLRRLLWEEIPAAARLLARAHRYTAPLVSVLAPVAPIPPPGKQKSMGYLYTKAERETSLASGAAGSSLGRLSPADDGPEVNARVGPLTALYRANLLLMPGNQSLYLGVFEDAADSQVVDGDRSSSVLESPVCFFGLVDKAEDPLNMPRWKLMAKSIALLLRECGPRTLLRVLKTAAMFDGIEQQALAGAGHDVSTGARVIMLERVSVDPEHQGRGIGTRLIDAILEKVRKASAEAPVFLTTQNEYTTDAYARIGFKVLRRDTIETDALTYPCWSMLYTS